MCEGFLKEKLQKAGLTDKYRVLSRSVSTDYEPEGSPANEQGQLVNTSSVSSSYFIFMFGSLSVYR